MSIIRCEKLSKNFKNDLKDPGVVGALKAFFKRKYRIVPAVVDFDLEIGAGEVVGLLGPNGAGKTTLMKLFTGIIAPTAGLVKTLGFEPFKRDMDFRRRIALVMGQKSQLWWDIPAIDSFLLLKSYYEIPKQTFDTRLEELTQILKVSHLLSTHVRRLSLGERMKMELIASLLHHPEILFLDEPTIGLDVVAQREMREFIKRYQRDRNTTIILTSHYMADVEALCARIVIILDGHKRFDGSTTHFEKLFDSEKFVAIYFADAVNCDSPIWNELQPSWSEDRKYVELRINQEKLRSVTSAILKDYPVIDFRTEHLPVERVMDTILSNPALLD